MELTWDLSSLYTSFHSEGFQQDMKALENKIQSIRKFGKENFLNTDHVKEKLLVYIELQNSFLAVLDKLHNFCELTLSANVKNKEAFQYSQHLQQLLITVTETEASFQKWLNKIENLKKLVQTHTTLKEHEFYINEMKRYGKFALSEESEKIIAAMKTTGSKAWLKLQETLAASLSVDMEWEGEMKEIPLSVVRNYAYEQNGALREKAYKAELAAYPMIEESSAAALSNIKGEVITEAKLRGYDSPLHMTLIGARMERDALEAMLSAVYKSLPMFRKYFLKKAELLGHKNGLPFYDLFAPVGNASMEYTYEEAKAFVIKHFTMFSQALGDYARHAFERNWIDVTPKEGKRGGAFCSNIHAIRESRVLINFSGSFSDVLTIAHELGHGYHGACLYEQSALNSHYPMPLAETASIFCETIVLQEAMKECKQEDSIFILESDIASSAQVVVDILSRYNFEKNVFEKRKESALFPPELNAMMLASQEESYGGGLDKNFLHPYMWVCKPHYYDPDFNYYNFPYTFGLLFAKGLYAKYLQEGKDFVAQYDYLLSETGRRSVYDIGRLAGIDVTSADFWKNSLRVIEKDIERFIEM